MIKKKLIKILSVPPYQLVINYKKKKQKSKSLKQINQYVQVSSVKKLQIGSGGTILKDWLNTDLILENEKIVFMDAGERFPIPDETFDYVYSEHLFEHLTFDQQCNYLKESWRILKPGGKMRLATPDFDFLIGLACENPNEVQKNYINWNYHNYLCNQSKIYYDEPNTPVYIINNYFKDWGHQLIHNKGSLSNLLLHFNFKEITKFQVLESKDVNFLKLEHHMNQIGISNNILETLILEATK